jgi:hypothetical protein
LSSSLEFFQSVYNDEAMPLMTRMRAAQVALPFEHAKLAVVAQLHGGCAAQLEAAMVRAGEPVVVDAKANAPRDYRQKSLNLVGASSVYRTVC